MGFSRLGGLKGRGLGLYYKGGSPTNNAAYGDAITFNVAGQPAGQIWLEQYVNGVLGYNGPFSIPMSPYTLSAKDKTGNWQSNAYTLVNGQKGTLLETSNLYVTGSPSVQPVTQVAQSGGGSLANGCLGSDGHFYTASEIQSLRTAFNAPDWLPAGCVLGPAAPLPLGAPVSSGGAPVNVATAPSIPGALPSGGTVGASYNQPCLNGFYRFILATGGGYATGANRAGCSATNSANCDPQFFGTLAEAIAYALQNGETPYKVDSAQEPWDLIACKYPPDPHKIYSASGSLGGGLSLTTLILGAGLIYFLGKSRRG